MCNSCNWHRLLVRLGMGDYYFSHIHNVVNLSHCRKVSNVIGRFLSRNYIYGLSSLDEYEFVLIYVTLCASCNQYHIWQITDGSMWKIWMWFEGPIFQFCKIENMAYEDINGPAFTNRNDSCFSRKIGETICSLRCNIRTVWCLSYSLNAADSASRSIICQDVSSGRN